MTLAPSATLTLNGADSLTSVQLGGTATVPATVYTPNLYASTVTAGGQLAVLGRARLGVAGFTSDGLLTLADGTGSTARTRLTNSGLANLSFGGGSRTVVGTPAGATAGGLAALDLGGRQAVVTGGVLENNGVVANGTVVAAAGGVVRGAGVYAGPVLTQGGGSFRAGNGPGRATAGGWAFQAGGQFDFQINHPAGQAGPTPGGTGWGLLRVRALSDPDAGTTAGNLSVTATAGSPYTLKLQTLTPAGPDAFGPLSGFNPSQPYSWAFLSYEGSYSGPADLNGVVAIDASQFVNSPAGGRFSLFHDTVAHQVGVSFTPGAGAGPRAAGRGAGGIRLAGGPPAQRAKRPSREVWTLVEPHRYYPAPAPNGRQ